MPVEPVSAAAAAMTGGTLFQYNRKNFMYDRTMRAATEYQIMEMQIKKQEMFREDVRDIVELTAVKMDTYTIITVIQMGFCIIALCEGRLGHGTPPWLICAHTLTLCTAFAYFLLSVWLAMHATVAAAAYKARLLTQVVRLPIPSWAQLEGARTYASQFEKTDARQMFRVPFLCGKQEDWAKNGCFPSRAARGSGSARGSAPPSQPSARRLGTVGFKDDRSQEEWAGAADYKSMPSTDPWGLERSGANIYEIDGTLQTDPRKLRHIQIVREAMQYWIAADGFARVTMSIGTQLLAIGLSYYVVGYVLILNHCVVGAWLAVTLFVAMSWAVFRIDMSLTRTEYVTALFLKCCPPFCFLASATLWVMDRDGLAIQVLMPIAYLCHTLWFVFLIHICKVSEQSNGVMLPTGYRAVMYIDVFGWIKRNVAGSVTASSPSAPHEQFEETERRPGDGPAGQGVRYENGVPVPMRIEQLPGANRQPRPADLSKASFAPATFVPANLPGNELERPDHYEPGTAGRRPWAVFLGMTISFATLWFVSGVIVFLQLVGLTSLNVGPQLEQNTVAALLEVGRNPAWLELGEQISTGWPHSNVNPIGLACNDGSKTMVVSTRFGLYTSDLSTSSHIQFVPAPTCEGIVGESLQDVSLQCDSSAGVCQAVVLHQHGRRLTTCALGEPVGQKRHDGNWTQPATSAKSISGQWLSGNSVTGKVRVQSLASTSQCSGDQHECAYVGTTDHRIVEMMDTVDSEGSHALFPKRLLGTKTSVIAPVPSGGMDVIRNRYLGILQQDGRRLQVHDLQSRGAIAGLWRLPDHPDDKAWIPQGKTWTSMCAAGDSLYLLSKGLSPQLWRFPLPKELRIGPGESS